MLLDPVIQMLHSDPSGTAAPYFRHEKGLFLCRSLVSRLHKESIPPDALEMDKQFVLCEKLYQIIIYHGLQSVRQMAYVVYNQYFDTFASCNPKSLTLIVKFALEKSNHSSLIGHAIKKLKNGKFLRNIFGYSMYC